MTGLLLLLIGGMVAAAWWHLVNGKERARKAAAGTCKEYQLQLMDDTVVLDAIEFKRKGVIRSYGLRYRFDFVHEGLLRHGGSVLILPGHPAQVVIKTRDGQLIIEN